jgi:hypothetical protein
VKITIETNFFVSFWV